MIESPHKNEDEHNFTASERSFRYKDLLLQFHWENRGHPHIQLLQHTGLSRILAYWEREFRKAYRDASPWSAGQWRRSGRLPVEVSVLVVVGLSEPPAAAKVTELALDSASYSPGSSGACGGA